jgi:hypothetical protein
MTISNAVDRALTLAVAHHIDCLKSPTQADELYSRLKSHAREGIYLLAGDIPDFVVSADYQYLSVTELLERVEVSANQMVEFGQLMLSAAQQGLTEVLGDGRARELDLEALADRFIRSALPMARG